MKTYKYEWSNHEVALETFKVDVIEMCDQKISWYKILKWWHVAGVNGVKVISILLFAFGTLSPLVSQLSNESETTIKSNESSTSIKQGDYYLVNSINNHNNKFMIWGYLSLASGSLVLLFDKFFGLSTNLNRYNVTLQAIISLKETFIVDWENKIIEAKNTASSKVIGDLLKLTKKFVSATNEVMKKEISDWSVEFSQRINEFSNKINKNQPS